MKKLIKLSFLFLFFTTLGCASDAVDCTTPPEPFIFQFIDKDSGENLFSNGTYDIKQPLVVTDLNTAKVIQTTYMKNDASSAFQINGIGWQTEKIKYGIAFSQDITIFELDVDSERINGKCSYTKFNSIEIKDADFQFDKTTGVYKILIDTKK